jgi:hypothetical protein
MKWAVSFSALLLSASELRAQCAPFVFNPLTGQFNCSVSVVTGVSSVNLNGGGAQTGAVALNNIAVTNASNTFTAGTQDHSGVAHTLPAVKGTTAGKPATCTVGEEYFATDATAGQNMFYCTSTNTWTQQLNSGASAVTSVSLNGGGPQTGAVALNNIAVTNASNTFTAGTQDERAAAHTLPAVTGTIAGKPATCTVGEMYFATDATAGANWYYCTATNTFTAQAAGGTGNAPQNHTVTFSTTPTYTCTSASLGTRDNFKLSTAVTANITSSTLSTCTTGEKLSFVFTQDATGSRTVAMPSGFQSCTLTPVPNKDTLCTYYWDGTTGWKEADNGDDTNTIFDQMAERGVPTVNPPAGIAACWPDSTDHVWECKQNNSGTNSTTISKGGDIGVNGVIANAAVNSAKTAAVNNRRTCLIDNDTQSATALTAAQFSGRCTIPAASTIVEVDLIGGTGIINGTPAAPTVTGTSSVQIGKYTPNGGASTTGLMSAAVGTTSGKACVLTSAAGTCINGNTSVSATITTTALAAGDILYVSAATADAAQTWYQVAVIYTIN